MLVINLDKNGKPIDLSKVTLSEDMSKEILEIIRTPSEKKKP